MSDNTFQLADNTPTDVTMLSFTAGTVHENGTGHTHDHTHDHDHGHTHEVMENPGKYTDRDRPVFRTDWKQVQSCKTESEEKMSRNTVKPTNDLIAQR